MARTVRFFQVDVFTDKPFSGNPAGVVVDADHLSEQQMQAISRELNNSETAFLLKPDAPDHDVRIRFFTPVKEVPTCGHATIAAHFVRANEMKLSPGRFWHKIGIGRLPVDIEKIDGEYRVIMTQGTPQIDPPLTSESTEPVLKAFGISGEDIAPKFPVARVDTGASKLMIGVKSREILNNLTPNNEALVRLSSTLNVKGYFVFTLTDPDPDVLAHCRMFAPQIGISEDPVTGNGNGPLGAYLAAFGLVKNKSPLIHFSSRQGEAMGRPGTAQVWVELEDQKPKKVRVGGKSVIVFRSQMKI